MATAEFARWEATVRAVEAERDRLRAALEEIVPMASPLHPEFTHEALLRAIERIVHDALEAA